MENVSVSGERRLEGRVSCGRPGGTDRRLPYPARRIKLDLDLRGAREGDDRRVSASAVVADCKIESGSGLTADESLRRSAWGTTRPPRAGLEARCPIGRTPMVVDLVGSGGAKSRVRPVAVVPGDVGGQVPLHGSEMVRDQNQSPGALVLDGADAALDHGEAALASDGTEALVDVATATPALE